jgi:hypothetical protein
VSLCTAYVAVTHLFSSIFAYAGLGSTHISGSVGRSVVEIHRGADAGTLDRATASVAAPYAIQSTGKEIGTNNRHLGDEAETEFGDAASEPPSHARTSIGSSSISDCTGAPDDGGRGEDRPVGSDSPSPTKKARKSSRSPGAELSPGSSSSTSSSRRSRSDKAASPDKSSSSSRRQSGSPGYGSCHTHDSSDHGHDRGADPEHYTSAGHVAEVVQPPTGAFRVRLFRLQEDASWVPIGTGHVSCGCDVTQVRKAEVYIYVYMYICST